MSNKPHKPPVHFKTRMPAVPPTPRPSGPPAKRSGHVALFLMGTLAVGGTAYALMPSNRCEPPPNTGQPTQLQSNPNCPPRSSSSSSSGGGSSSRTSYYSSSDSSSSHASSSSSSTAAPASSSVARGGFGSFGHAVSFSGGG